MKRLLSLLLVLMLVMGALAGCGQSSKQEANNNTPQQNNTPQPSEEKVYQRNETLYYGGAMWGPPSNWNPLVPGNVVAGVVGLIYETLFNYDPVKNDLIPWLAEKGEWTSDKSYKVTLRDGLTWQDGKPLTSDDVRFTFEIAKENSDINYSPIWRWLESIETPDAKTIVFNFSTPHYHEWTFDLYQIPIIPKHIWEGKSKDKLLKDPNEKAIGSGPYLFDTYSNDRMVYKRNDNWWGIKALGLTPAPKRVVSLAVPSNNVALGMLMKGELDFSNFFLPGIPSLKSNYGITTFYDNPPYMIPDSTVFLFINTTKAPLNNVELRRAMAYAINPKVIVDKAYENQVMAANPLGFLPIKAWEEYYDNNVVSQYGFSYDPQKAKSILDAAGFKLGSDGIRTAPDGKKFKLEISVPYGWTDWMESAKIIADQLKAVGLDVEAKFPDFNKYYEDLTKGNFDLMINSFGSQTSISPWTLYNWLFAEIKDTQYNGNFGRFDAPGLRDLVDKFNETKMGSPEAKQVASQLEEIFLKNMPAIPIWYNGLWFQASNAVWENWPTEHDPYAYPCGWGGRWQTGGTMTLMKIKPKASQ
ncbi:peptide/nickel transport system substrate-binding protein [Thermoanaerobacter uzonensis DSM 18761]|uniref:Peptide/nickel transport system substrate-binding protein n=1 Tax=Thermoanaerobacter uzonensis DSM 18761 TaxID=1123369 RepID=A0A1M4STV4_9THEO|nr:ABC transporter substrate-binding protein [Thermoanaerobacter uzonensis]SHE35447.1 peptide/nickel transport system substrate-binding protein [Thermoanaerobacter uzonensis DSM 18761]